VPSAKALTALNGVMIVVGGVLVLLGWHRFIGAGLLVIAVLPAPFLLHAFWKETDPVLKTSETLHFLKDLALAGAALLIAAYSGAAWPMSLGG
jgi:putative oxidoreductase